MRDHVDHFLSRVSVGDNRAHRNAQLDVLSRSSVAICASSVLPVWSLMLARVSEVDQRIDVAIGDDPDAAAAPAIAAIGAALGDEFFASEGSASIAAVAGGDFDRRFIDEFH